MISVISKWGFIFFIYFTHKVFTYYYFYSLLQGVRKILQDWKVEIVSKLRIMNLSWATVYAILVLTSERRESFSTLFETTKKNWTNKGHFFEHLVFFVHAPQVNFIVSFDVALWLWELKHSMQQLFSWKNASTSRWSTKMSGVCLPWNDRC